MSEGAECLIIVPQDQPELYDRLRAHFSRRANIQVRLDARTGARATSHLNIFAVGGGSLRQDLRADVEANAEVEIDPKSAVGILEAFAREHPDFGHAAVFFVLPAADPPNRLFNQPAYVGKKLRFLASRGYEIGNHTLWHANLGKYDETTVRAQIAGAQQWIQRLVPDYKIRALALPHGVYPKDVSWALSGSAKGVAYSYEAILRVSGGPAPSPFVRAFDPVRLPRIQAIESELRHWLTLFERHAEERFVSDGDPTVVTVPAALRDRLRSDLRALRVVER